MSHSLWVIPTRALTDENPQPVRISAITEFYVSKTGVQCAEILLSDGSFDSCMTKEIEVR